MKCFAYCTASSYEVKGLFNALSSRYKATKTDLVIHIEVPTSEKTADVFFFPYGTAVMWNVPEDKIKEILKEIKPFEGQPLTHAEDDEFDFEYGERIHMKNDIITLPNKETISKLAFSHGLAQSVKIESFESAIIKTFERTKHLPEELARFGRIPLSRREIRKRIGELFIERNSINLHVDVLDTPNFFWDNPDYEEIYIIVAKELNISGRTEILNQQLNVVHELFQMLSNELNSQHSNRLEWAIIWLIIIEVFILLFHDVLKLI